MNIPKQHTDSETGPSRTLSLEQALQLAIQLHQTNKLVTAEQIYLKLLEIQPENPSCLHFLGLLRYQCGHQEQGAGLIKKALTISPEYFDALNNLGNIYLQMGYPDDAEPFYRQVITLKPEYAAAHGNLGVALKELGRYDEAIHLLLTAIELDPSVACYFQNLGNTYKRLGQYTDAVKVYRHALTLDATDSVTFRQLSQTLYVMGEIDSSTDMLRQWLALDAENPTALHMLAAFTRDNIPFRASDAYVKQTFDRFAASFDGVLKRLDYQAPFLVYQALKALATDIETWHALDAGCGTGLFGELVRPVVNRLTGIDLSPKMLERARSRGVYDAVFEAELTDFFSQSHSTYDVITCVDTLCYFGDLHPVFQATVNALKPNGWIILTLEVLSEQDAIEDYRLNVHGRYSHKASYVRNTLNKAGFSVYNIDSATLRKEGREAVEGLVVTAQIASGRPNMINT